MYNVDNWEFGEFGSLVRQEPNNSVYLASYGRAIMILLQVCQPTNSFALIEGDRTSRRL